MRSLIAMLVAVTLPLSVVSANELATMPSKHSVEETLDRLTAALKDKGITPVARIDHASAAKAAGLALKPTAVLLFGNPRLGTPLMQSNRLIAIDLPMRILAWEDDAGKVWIAYNRPETLKSRYDIQGHEQAWQAMSGALENFARAAAD